MNWTPAKALEDMDRDGVATSIVSTSEPNVWFGEDAAARTLARECNEYGARLMADHPGRFGMFATLPLPDVDGALREIEYAFDTLKADGACFMSSYQGKYLGDPRFAPVMDELNRRRAVCYTHPVRGESMVNLLPDGRALGITLTTETTLTIASVLYSGTAARCPDIRFIWSHGGGTMPYITSRFNAGNAPDMAQKLPQGVMYRSRSSITTRRRRSMNTRWRRSRRSCRCRTSSSAPTIRSRRQAPSRRGSPATASRRRTCAPSSATTPSSCFLA